MVRRAGMNDLASVQRLARSLWPDDAPEALGEEMREVLLNEGALVALCFVDGAAVGFAQCGLRRDYVEGTRSSPVGYLEGIFVEESRRGQGIARDLLRYCEAWAKEKGCSEFASDCELTNEDSLRFHLRVGFAQANRIICFHKNL